MADRVAIIGVGQTAHASRRPDVDPAELVLEAIDEALDDSGIGLADIDNSVTACMDFWDGRTIANMSIAEVVGSYRKSEARTCADAVQALLYMWTRIASGSFRIGLVTAHCKESSGNLSDIEVAATDPFTQRRLELDGPVINALIARSLLERGAYDLRTAAEVVVEARRRGATNPKTQILTPLAVDDVLTAPLVSDPIRELDIAPRCDGSVAFVVASEDVAAGLGAESVWVTGVSTATGSFWSDGELGSSVALETAKNRAATMAGWGADVADLVEISAEYSYQHVMYSPTFGKDPLDPTLNSSGGWLAGNPFVVSGGSRVAESAIQLRGAAGDRQLSDVHRAYAHGIHGLGGQTHSVVALEGGS